MPTLLQISVTAGADSTGRCADLIGRIAMESGWRSVIAFGRRRPVTLSETIRIGHSADIAFHGMASRLADAHGRWGRRATQRFIADVEKLNPDIIHLHNIHGYYLHYPTLSDWLRRSGRPIVWTMHDTWAFTGHCAFPDAVDCTRWRRGCGNCPLTSQYPASWFIDASRANYADKMRSFSDIPNLTIVPVSHWLDNMLARTPLASYPRTVIHNGIDTSLYTPRTNAADARPVAIALATPWAPRKGLDHFYALRNLLPPQWRLAAVGLSHHQLKHLPQGIEGLPKQNTAELSALLRQATVTAIPSLADNYPTVILESLASGTPVATYEVGGCTEAISPLTGCSAPRGDVEALAAAVIKASGLSRSDCAATSAATDYRTALKPYFALYGQLTGK